MKYQPDVAAKAAELVRHMNALARRLMLRAKPFRGGGPDLTRQEFRLVLTLGDEGPSIMRDLAARLGIAVSTLTVIVDRLVRKRLAERSRLEEDRRAVRLALTDTGRRRYQRCRKRRLRMALAMLQALDAKEQDALLRLFRKIGGAGIPTVRDTRQSERSL